MKKLIKDYAFMILGGILYAFATCFFIFPASIILGGTSGISVILEYFIPVSAGSILAIINVLLMVLAFIILGKNSAAKTFIGSIITTAAIKLFDVLFPFSEPLISNIYISAIMGAALIAAATALLVYVDSSSGGTDIIALIIKKFSSMNIGVSLLISDVLIVVLGGIISGRKISVGSVIGLLIKTFGVNVVLSILKMAENKISVKNPSPDR